MRGRGKQCIGVHPTGGVVQKGVPRSGNTRKMKNVNSLQGIVSFNLNQQMSMFTLVNYPIRKSSKVEKKSTDNE